MLSKAKVKYLKSLQVKKFRRIHNSFMVEGAKSVLEILNSNFQVLELYATEDFAKTNKEILSKVGVSAEIVKEEELIAAGTFSSNDAALAVASIVDNIPLKANDDELALVLNDIQDPGNLGTIIRIADWYGITKIICSNETADLYNPKVINSTMGSFTRVRLFYTDLQEYLTSVKGVKIYGALLDGENIHHLNKGKKSGYLIMGNESKGINDALLPYITDKVTIPRFGGAESLNVGVATAVLCDNLLRDSN